LTAPFAPPPDVRLAGAAPAVDVWTVGFERAELFEAATTWLLGGDGWDDLLQGSAPDARVVAMSDAA